MRTLTQIERRRIIEETVESYRRYLNPGYLRDRKSGQSECVEWKAEGPLIWDVMGKEFIDCLGGYGVLNVGHRHPKVIGAVIRQLDYMGMSAWELLNWQKARLARLLASIMPGDLQYSFFTNSGTESVEGALKLARYVTGKPGIISTVRSFHGRTFGSLSATGRDLFRDPFKPLVPGFKHVPYGDVDALEAAIDDETAAVILEPIQGEGGIILPPRGYFAAVRTLCDRKEVLLIADEIQTGFGRTGKMFGMEHYGVAPDIMTLAKAMSGGVIPIGAFTATERVWRSTFANPNRFHCSTFGGNPLACVAASACIEVILEERLPKRAAEMGEYFLMRLRGLQQRYPDLLADVRGKGLLIGVEFVSEQAGIDAAFNLYAAGVLVAHTLNNAHVIRLEPPLVISREQIDTVIERFDAVLACLHAGGCSQFARAEAMDSQDFTSHAR